jgi:Na+/melibiose symporter-like transporter
LTEPALDPRRVRTLVGLILGRLGPRAFGAVAGIFLALLVAQHTESLIAVTFALTAHRIVTWLAFPLTGRISDRSSTTLGRRVPYMALGLLVGGICTALLVRTTSYWQLVGVLMVARLAFVAYIVPSAAVTPEAFGNKRWLRAGVVVTVGGVIVGISIRVTALATWEQSDPSTWAPAYYLSAAYIVFAALATLLLVREAPVPVKTARNRSRRDSLATARSALEQPNAKPLLAGILLAIASGGAFDRAYPIYAEQVLGAGGDSLAAGGIATAVLSCAAFPVSWVISHRISRRNTALWAGITGAAAAIAHLFVTEFSQSVVIGVASQIFLVAAVLALAPFYLRILPREGGLGERIGVIFSPVLLAGMVASFATGAIYDFLVEDYRVIWIPTAVFSLASGITIWAGLRGPEGRERSHPGRMFKTLRKLLWGRGEDRQLFRGELAEHEVDGTVLLELVSDELNPYSQRV